jgi:hypothetical protein
MEDQVLDQMRQPLLARRIGRCADRDPHRQLDQVDRRIGRDQDAQATLGERAAHGHLHRDRAIGRGQPCRRVGAARRAAAPPKRDQHGPDPNGPSSLERGHRRDRVAIGPVVSLARPVAIWSGLRRQWPGPTNLSLPHP